MRCSNRMGTTCQSAWKVEVCRMPHNKLAKQPSMLWKRFGRNFAAFSYSQVVTLAVQFLAVPFFLHHWGKERYAEWLVISGLPIMLGLLDFGVAHASASKATMLAAKHDADGVRCSLQTAIAFSLTVAALILVLMTAAGHFIDWHSLLKLATLDSMQANLVLLLLCVHLGMNLLGGPLNAWFVAMDRTATGYFLLANRRLLDVFVTIAVLAFGGNALTLALALAIGQALLLLGLTLCAHHLSPWPILGLRHASTNELRSIFKPAVGHIGITFGQVITLQCGVQLLNQIAPASVVVLYSMSRTLMRLVMQVGTVANHALRPELSRLLGMGNQQMAWRFTRNIGVVVTALALGAYLALVAMGPWLMKWWSGGAVIIASRLELAAIGLHALINVPWTMAASYMMAGNTHARISLVYFAGCIAGIACWIVPFPPATTHPIFVAAVSLSIPEVFAALYLVFMRARISAAYFRLPPPPGR